MPPTPDHQLGAELKLRRPAGRVSRQVLEGMVRDLVGGDQSLLAPLLHLVGRPGFLALDPRVESPALRLITRDQLLADLADTYHPRVVSRLREVLEGYLHLAGGEAASGYAPVDPPATELLEPAPAPPAGPHPSPPASATPAADPWVSAPAAPAASPQPPTAASPAGMHPDPWLSVAATGPVFKAVDAPAEAPEESSAQPTTTPAGAGSPRWLPLQIGLAVFAGTLTVVAASQPPLCRLIGICAAPKGADSQPASASSKTLAAAEKAAKAMKAAPDLRAYEQALSNLDRELLRLSGDPLSTEQQRQRDALQASAQEGQQRLSRERRQAETVANATRRLDGLESLSAERQEAERSTVRQELEAIPALSFSHGAAQQQLRRLLASPSPPPVAPPEPSAPAAAPPEPRPAPAPTPTPRTAPTSGGRWSGGGGSWSSPPRRQAPAPAEADDGNSNAPYRDDPLF